MRTATFNVSDSILKWVLEVSGDLLNKKWINNIHKWLSSEKKNPTIVQLQHLSKRSRLPFGYFFLKEPPKIKLPILHFRTIKNENIKGPSKELVDTILSMRTKVDWLRHYRITQGDDKVPFVGICNKLPKQMSYEKIADNILNYFRLKPGWNYRTQSSNFNRFNFLRNRISNYGITVMTNSVVGNSNNRPLNINEFRAFVLTDSYAPLIFINSRDSKRARLFSLVHELVHLGYDNQEIFNCLFQTSSRFTHKRIEQLINDVVEQILYPKKLFIESWNKRNDVKYEFKIERVAKEFGTSPYSTAIRAHNLHLINNKIVNMIRETSKDDYKKLERDRKRRNRSSKGGPSYYRVLAYKTDKSLAFDVIRSIRSGQTSYTNGYDLLNVSCGPQLDKLMDNLKEGN